MRWSKAAAALPLAVEMGRPRASRCMASFLAALGEMSDPHEFLFLVGLDDVLVKRLVHFRPALQGLHVPEPAADIRKRFQFAANDFTTEDHHRAEIVGKRDVVAAEKR